jgi:serine/threonine protein kinase
MGKDTNMSQITKDYVDPERKILRVLAQRYELKEELGKGAHGKIYSGKDRVTKLSVAVKIVSFKNFLILCFYFHLWFTNMTVFRWKNYQKTKANLRERSN